MNANRKYDAMFFGLLVNKDIPSIEWSDVWYNLKLSIHYFKRFFYTIWWFRGSDRGYTLKLLEIALKEHLRVISDKSGYYEVDEDRIPKENAIKRCLEILNNIEEDNYMERCGYVMDYNITFEKLNDGSGNSLMVSDATPEQEARNTKAFEDGHVLEEKEFQELMGLLGNPDYGLRTWWV